MVSERPVDASSLRIREVRKSFPAPEDPSVRRIALDGITLTLAGNGDALALRVIDRQTDPDATRPLPSAEDRGRPSHFECECSPPKKILSEYIMRAHAVSKHEGRYRRVED